ncbi:hypothetical protein SVAN01_01290 [Stagonosporopsis vannaccii]|nr:hypothetical protein SVAN01_01290 [Stagonosporopsis vannaccii]
MARGAAIMGRDVQVDRRRVSVVSSYVRLLQSAAKGRPLAQASRPRSDSPAGVAAARAAAAANTAGHAVVQIAGSSSTAPHDERAGVTCAALRCAAAGVHIAQICGLRGQGPQQGRPRPGVADRTAAPPTVALCHPAVLELPGPLPPPLHASLCVRCALKRRVQQPHRSAAAALALVWQLRRLPPVFSNESPALVGPRRSRVEPVHSPAAIRQTLMLCLALRR